MESFAKSLALKLFETMNTRDFSIIQPLINEQTQLNFPGVDTISGGTKVITFLKILLRKYPELQFTIHDFVTEEERVCVIWTNKGKKVNGDDYENSGITLVTSKNGKLLFISDYFKNTSFLEK